MLAPRFAFLLAAALGALTTVACSSTASEDVGVIAPLALNEGDAGAAAPAPVDCTATVTQGECVTCCSDKQPEGFKIYTTAVLSCLCDADVCGAECGATYCSGTNPTQACADCANGRGQAACLDPVSAACGASDSCIRLNQCFDRAQCATKPAF